MDLGESHVATSHWLELSGMDQRCACETWVPLDPHQPGSRLSPTGESGPLEDPSTCQ
jgi:hypothetical protein